MTKRILRRLLILTFLLLTTISLAAPILASGYTMLITLSNSSSTSYTDAPWILSIDNAWMASNDFMQDDGLDVLVADSNTLLSVPTMVADDKTLFVADALADSQAQYYLTTGNDPVTSMPIIVGQGGYVTTADAAALEPDENIGVLIAAFIDTSSGSDKRLVYKQGAVEIYVSGDEDITAVVTTTSGAITLVATGVTTGYHTVDLLGTVASETVILYIDAVEADSDTFAAAVVDTAYDWIWNQNDVMAYVDYAVLFHNAVEGVPETPGSPSSYTVLDNGSDWANAYADGIVKQSDGTLWTTITTTASYDNNQIVYCSTDNGETWTQSLLLEGDGDPDPIIYYAISLAVDSSNRVYAIYLYFDNDDYTTTGATIAMQVYLPGSGWQSPVQVNDSYPAASPVELKAAVDQYDRVHVVYGAFNTEGDPQPSVTWYNKDVRYARLDSYGSSWAHHIWLTDNPEPTYVPVLQKTYMAVDDLDNLNVIFTRSGSPDTTYYTRSADSGTTWSTPEAISNSAATDGAYYTSARVDSDGNFYVSFSELFSSAPCNVGTFKVRNFVSGLWSDPVTVASNNTQYKLIWPNMVLDQDDNLRVFYADVESSPTALYYKDYADGEWGTPVTLASDNGTNVYTITMSTRFPEVGSVRTNLPEFSEVNLVWTDRSSGYIVTYTKLGAATPEVPAEEEETLVQYQPIDIISGTTLPDRAGIAQNGAITWGSNPVDVTVNATTYTSPESYAAPTGESSGTLPTTTGSDNFAIPDGTADNLINNPLWPLVKMISDTADLTEIQVWQGALSLLLLILVAGSLLIFMGHALISGFVGLATVSFGVSQEIYPWGAIVLAVIYVLATLLLEAKQGGQQI